MKIKNTTNYDTATLRRCVLAVVRDVERTLYSLASRGEHPRVPSWSREKVEHRAEFIRKHCSVIVRRYEHERRGRASYAGDRMWLSLFDGTVGRAWTAQAAAKDGFVQALPTTATVLWLIQHEVWHLFGIRHPQMPDAVNRETPAARESIRDRFASLIAELGETMPLVADPEPKAVEPSDERAVRKIAALAEREKRWTTKLRRAQTALAKLRKSRTYYERQIEKAASDGKVVT